MSNAKLDLPEPLSPVTTLRACRGISTLMFFRLCWRAPRTLIRSIMNPQKPTAMNFDTKAIFYRRGHAVSRQEIHAERFTRRWVRPPTGRRKKRRASPRQSKDKTERQLELASRQRRVRYSEELRRHRPNI